MHGLADAPRRMCWSLPDQAPDCEHCVARGLSLCADLDRKGLDRLREGATLLNWRKGAELCEQGQRCDRVLILTGGTVKLYRLLSDGERHVTGFLGPGDILGGLKVCEESCCTAQALTEGAACAFDRERFMAVVSRYTSILLKLLVTASDEIEAQHLHTVLLGRKLGEERVAAFLLMMCHRLQFQNVETDTVHLPMTREDIADYLGLTLESVSRALSRLKARKYIEMPSRDRVVLKNYPALYRLSGFEEVPHHTVALGM